MPDILTRTLTRAFASKAAQRPTPAWLRAESRQQRFNMPDLTDAEKQANLYAALVWMQIAIGKVAEVVATTPFAVSKRGREGLQAIEDHPFEMLLEQPNPHQDQFELLEATCSWRMLCGNCYWWLNKTGEDAPPEEIWIIPAYQVQPVPDGQSYIQGYVYDPGYGQKIPLEPWEVVHFKTFNPLNRYVGLSAAQSLALDSIGDIAAQRYNMGFYAEDNAKQDGILAFADFVDQGKWDRLKAEWREEHGGTKQKRLAMLRGVGAGGVQFIQTGLTRQEIQYLEVRTFTKEEIFARLAPGLASILAVNATEANSTAGKDTFLSMAVYPQSYALGTKITQAVLPLYGDGLVAAFEDVRRVDTQVELLEQAAYERSHTIEEVRQKYYQDKPIGDGRDLLLPAEVGKGMTDARAPEDKPPPPAPFGQQPTPADLMQQAGKALDKKRWREKAVKALAAGRAADVPFDPDYLTDAEAMEIKASLRRASTADDVWRAVGEG